MRILTEQEATHVERPEGYAPWVWPEPANVAISRCGPVINDVYAKARNGDPLSFALAVNFFETLYANGYVIAKLEEGETALAECTSGHWHAELKNMLTGVTVEVGQVWTGITGNRLVVREVKDGRARLGYEDYPGDETWEDCADIVLAFTLAAPR